MVVTPLFSNQSLLGMPSGNWLIHNRQNINGEIEITENIINLINDFLWVNSLIRKTGNRIMAVYGLISIERAKKTAEENKLMGNKYSDKSIKKTAVGSGKIVRE